MKQQRRVRKGNSVLEVRMEERDVSQPMSVEKDLPPGADQDHHLLHLVNKYARKEHFNY